MTTTEETTNQVALLPPALTAATLFMAEDPKASVAFVLDHVRAQVADFQPDTSTRKGRDAIATMAHKVARSKTALDDMGKELVADWKRRSAAVDVMRREIRDSLDKIKDEVRAPLTQWENDELERKRRIDAEIVEISGMSVVQGGVEEIDARIVEVDAIVIDERFGDQQARAELAKSRTLTTLALLLAKARADEAEAARMRADAAERARAKAEAKAAEPPAAVEIGGTTAVSMVATVAPPVAAPTITVAAPMEWACSPQVRQLLVDAAPRMLSLLERWLAIDAGSWHPIRNGAERKDLFAETRALVAEVRGQS